ncbi:hypothetical protein F4604DRAFT_1686190 [Suillus subluteus]|nr:hypothetical protein F4604DRAFT_1686190 [Suillus subluteus]
MSALSNVKLEAADTSSGLPSRVHDDLERRLVRKLNLYGEPEQKETRLLLLIKILHVQVGMNALDDHVTSYNEAAGHFTSAINTIGFLSMLTIHSRYDVFVVLFGWDLESLW